MNQLRIFFLSQGLSYASLYLIYPTLVLEAQTLFGSTALSAFVFISMGGVLERCAPLVVHKIAANHGEAKALTCSYIMRSAGLCLLLFNNLPSLIISIFLFSFSTAINITYSKTLIGAIADPKARQKAFGRRAQITNIGVAAGSGMFVILGAGPYRRFVALAILIQLAAVVFGLVMYHKHSLKSTLQTKNITKNSIDRDGAIPPRMLACLGLSFLFYVLLVQLQTTMPMHISSKFGRQIVAEIFLINGLLVSLLQFKVAENTLNEKHHEWIIVSGFMLLTIGFVLMGLANEIFVLFFGVVLLTFGEMILEPNIDSSLTSFCLNIDPLRKFALQGFASGLGMAFGGIFCGSLYLEHLNSDAGAENYWAIMGGGVVVASLIALPILKNFIDLKRNNL